MQHTNKIVTVVGGTGFLGRYVVSGLAELGYRVQILCRHPEQAYNLKTAGDPGQITARYADLSKPETLKGVFSGSFATINLVGLLFEKGSQNFSDIHNKGAELTAKFSYQEHVERFIHISSLGVDRATTSSYARTKYLGEQAVQDAFPGATILRPSVIFGAEDNFYNQFAKFFSLFPAFPLIGSGTAKFQPVYVADVADAILTCLEMDGTAGEVFELGGPEVQSFKEILHSIIETTGSKTRLFPLPSPIAKLKGRVLAQLAKLPFAPTPVFTADQVRLLSYDNVVSGELPTLEDLDIYPAAPSAIVPEYLAHYKKH